MKDKQALALFQSDIYVFSLCYPDLHKEIVPTGHDSGPEAALATQVSLSMGEKHQAHLSKRGGADG
jgi:hypothetical protein